MRQSRRFAPLSGLLFVVLFVLAVIILGSTGDTPEEVRDYYADNEGRIFAGFFVLVASALAFLWFTELSGTSSAASRSNRAHSQPWDTARAWPPPRCSSREPPSSSRRRTSRRTKASSTPASRMRSTPRPTSS